QDIMDTATVLQLKEVVAIIEEDIKKLQNHLINITINHKHTVLPGRTHGQHGLPTTFGYKTAIWLDEINRHSERLQEIKPRLIVGKFSGAVGTLASIEEKGLELQTKIMKELSLNQSLVSWHTARDRFTEFACFIAMLGSSIEKIANEIFHLQKTEFGELAEPFYKGNIG